MTRDAKPTCVAGRPASWCSFIPSLNDVIGLGVFYRSAQLAFYGTLGALGLKSLIGVIFFKKRCRVGRDFFLKFIYFYLLKAT